MRQNAYTVSVDCRRRLRWLAVVAFTPFFAVGANAQWSVVNLLFAGDFSSNATGVSDGAAGEEPWR